MLSTSFAALTAPRSVAVVGASDPDRSFVGGRAFLNLLAGPADRRVYPVNPRLAGGELLGHRVYGSLGELPEAPDLVVIATPAGTVSDLLEEIAQVGSKEVVIFSAPRDTEPLTTAEFHSQIRRAADEHGLAIVGPNCLGLVNCNEGLAVSFATAFGGAGQVRSSGLNLRPGGLAMLSQSGGPLSYMLKTLADTPIGYSHLVSTGDEAALSLADLLEHVVEDEATTSIILFLEGGGDGALLRRSLARARELGKLVGLMKVGRSDVGRLAAKSHSGRMTGDASVFRALCEELGVAEARSYQDLFDLAYRFGLMGGRGAEGRRAAVVSTSGGTGVASADLLREAGWTLPPLSDSTTDALRSTVGEAPFANPVDIQGAWVNVNVLSDLVRVIGDSGEYDEVFLMTGAGPDTADAVATQLAATVSRGLAVPLSVGWSAVEDSVRRTLEQAGVAVFPDQARAVRAATAHANGVVGSAESGALGELVRRMDAVRARGEGSPVGGELVGASALFGALAEEGIRVAPYAVVGPGFDERSLESAVGEIGFPVAVKIESERLSHKTDVGGVILNVGSLAELNEACGRLHEIAVAHSAADARFVIQQMVQGVEVLVGGKWDATFGPVLSVGLGGTLTELLAEHLRTTLLPTTAEHLEGLVARNDRLTALLKGFRGADAVDGAGLVDLVGRVADWLLRHGPLIAELDLNPVIVTPDGAFVVDARAVGTLRSREG